MTTNVPANVKNQIDATIKAEGGDKITNNPKDRGGLTKYGITQATWEAYGYSGSVADATYEQAFELYVSRFWTQPGFGGIAEVSQALANELFDWGVTSGPANPSKALQRALNSFNREQADYPDIAADGRIGPMTLHALKAFHKRRGAEGLRYLHELVQALRRVFYLEISERDKSQEEFQNGWQSRIK